jgi:glyoxylase-like metal-dependent hydrolase (beta-lactamase superfamily II)
MTSMSRLALAALALAAAACSPKTEPPAAIASALLPAGVLTPTPEPAAATADVKRFNIGAFEAIALHDGDLHPANDNKTLATNKTKADVDALLIANHLATDPIDLSIQPLLVKTSDRVLLFDTGAAAQFGPTAGLLPASLASAGVDPASVTDIFISHAHGDHVGGLVKADNTLAFPNAAIHISANEWTALKGNAQMAALVTAITPKVVEFQPGAADIVPGVKAVDIRGHTPGHSGYLITSGTESLLYIGDTMHHSVISVQQPDWTIAFDGNAGVAQASRKALLESTAASAQRIYAVHFPFPGLGKFEKQGDHYVWVPEP